jgi:CHAD domain-containing protein
MLFRFREADGTVEAGLRRIAGEQIDEALAAIRSQELPVERVVHEVRRRCKAVRGLIRLVRPSFPAFENENAAFREIGGALAAARDGKVLVDTLDGLIGDEEDALDPCLLHLLRKRLDPPPEKGRPLRQILRQCEEELVAARVRAATWTLRADGWSALGDGFEKTLRAAHHAMKRAVRSGQVEASHAWRKQVKYHWYHVRVLRGIAAGAAEERSKAMEKLGELLGERHDLDLLAEMLHARQPPGSHAETIDQLTAQARKRAARLEDKARRLGEKLFAEKPRKVAAKWGERWENRAREEEPA